MIDFNFQQKPSVDVDAFLIWSSVIEVVDAMCGEFGKLQQQPEI